MIQNGGFGLHNLQNEKDESLTSISESQVALFSKNVSGFYKQKNGHHLTLIRPPAVKSKIIH